MRRKKKVPLKKCPRCQLTMPEQTEVCPDCNLSFDRLSIATNKDAKSKILRGERDYIIRTTTLPSDVVWYKLLLMTLFLGFFGGHNFYVGRYLKGFIYLAISLLSIFCVIFNTQILAVWNGTLMEILGVIIGLYVIVWFIDIWLVAFKKFKVPIAIDLKDDEGIK